MELIIKTAELSIKATLQSVKTAELMFIPRYSGSLINHGINVYSTLQSL